MEVISILRGRDFLGRNFIVHNDIIPSDFSISEEIVKKVLLKQFSLKVEDSCLIGEGWDNRAYLINNTWIFRFPRRKETIAGLEREMRILPKIHSLLPLNIPQPAYFGVPSDDFPEVFYGYKKLVGTSGCALLLSSSEYIETAYNLGLFLKKLHSIVIENLHLEPIDLEPIFNRLELDNLFINLHNRLKEVEKFYDMKIYEEKIKNICSMARTYQFDNEKLVLTHNDLYHRHLLFNNLGQLTSVIDWGDCGLSNFVVDLGVLYQYFPSYAHASFFQAYGKVSNDALDYARFLGLYYAIALLWFGNARNDHDLVRSSLGTLAEI